LYAATIAAYATHNANNAGGACIARLTLTRLSVMVAVPAIEHTPSAPACAQQQQQQQQ